MGWLYRDVQQRVQAIARAYTSDVAMAMSVMVALQVVGLLLVVQLIRTVG
jgi:hypothetical protein